VRVYDAVSLQLGPASFSFGVSAFYMLKRFLYYRAVLCLTLIRWDFVSGAVEQFWPDVVCGATNCLIGDQTRVSQVGGQLLFPLNYRCLSVLQIILDKMCVCVHLIC